MSFLAAAKKRNQRLGAIAYDGGLNTPRFLDLRNAGYLDRLRLTQTLSGQYGTAGPTAVDQFGQYGGAVSRILVRTNSIAPLFDCTAQTTALISAIDNAYYGRSHLLQPAPTAVAAAPGTAAFADTWFFDIPISIWFNTRTYPVGLFQTAINSQETAIEVRFNPVNAVVTTPGSGVYVPGGGATGPTPVGAVDIQQLYYDPIPTPADQPFLGYIHLWREWISPISADGDNEFRLPPSNFYLRVIYQLVTTSGGNLSLDGTSLTRLALRYGANLAPYDEPTAAVVGRMAEDYGFSLPAGVYVHDFITRTHNEQDVINGGATTDLRAVLTTAIGARSYTNAYVKIAVEQLVPLVAPAPGQAAPQGPAAAAA